MDMKRIFRGWMLAILLVFVLLIVVLKFTGSSEYTKATTSQVVKLIETNQVKSAILTQPTQVIQIIGTKGQHLEAAWVGNQGNHLATVLQAQANAGHLAGGYNILNPVGNSLLSVLLGWLPFIVIFLLFFVFMNQMQGGGSRVMNFGKSRAKLITKDTPKTTFADVAGADEAIEELEEIKEFLQTPAKFQAIGAKIPKGVLLYGPPGTGKTLLARAVAGEAGVPFYSISGSDFVEMFVGVGASRVRDLFEQAKQNSPCIIFVDEIDAVGRQRGAGLGGGHDEREQTLNQLLVEMDGFGERQGVILIAATNRPDILDPALLRPGRFDRHVTLDRPDIRGRRAILEVHAKNKPLDKDTDLETLARQTPGFSGADLSNLINEAAILTARENGTVITGAALEEAVDRVVGGPRRKGRIISEHEKKITAYHEGGHTLAAWAMPDIDPIYKVTILARGRTGGHAMAVPEDDKGLMTRSEMIARLVFAMGGRAAEELVFREPTTGAVSDIEQATKIARAMVTEYGMSSKLGAVRYGTEHGDPFLGRTMGNQADYSHEVARDIDDEARKLIEAAHTEAWRILTEHRDVLDIVADELLEKETLHRAELEAIFADVVKRPRLTVFDDFGGRIPSDKPPIKTPGELAIERGEPWPLPVPEPDFKKAIAEAAQQAGAASSTGGNGNGSNGLPATQPHPVSAASQPDYGAPAGWRAPGWPPKQQADWHPPTQGQPQSEGGASDAQVRNDQGDEPGRAEPSNQG